MAQPVWITPAGSLGTIPEGIFYQTSMLADTATIATNTCTATSSATNLITCDSTANIWPGLNVIFSGGLFGGVSPTVRYFVLAVPDSTHFSIAPFENSTAPIVLQGLMFAMIVWVVSQVASADIQPFIYFQF